MMNAVIGSLLENLKAITIVTEPTVEAFKKDKTNTGDSREATVQEFVRRYLPADFRVKEQSKIYSKLSSTNNIDCVVLAPNHPQLITPIRTIVLAEGVYAAIEVKPDINVLTDGSELMRGLNQIKSVKNIIRTVERLDFSVFSKTAPLPDYYNKIPSVLFSFRSTNIENTIEFIISKIHEGVLQTNEIPDIIVTLDKGVIFYTPHLSSTQFAKFISLEQQEFYGEEVFIHYETDKQEVTLALFLLFFLNFKPPMILIHDFIIKKYLDDDSLRLSGKIYGVRNSLQKAADILKQEIQQIIKSNQSVQQDEEPGNNDIEA